MSSLKLTINNEEAVVKLYDNPSSTDFLTLLPLTLTFEDYAGTEKISNLSKKLKIEVHIQAVMRQLVISPIIPLGEI